MSLRKAGGQQPTKRWRMAQRRKLLKLNIKCPFGTFRNYRDRKQNMWWGREAQEEKCQTEKRCWLLYNYNYRETVFIPR